VADLGSLSVTSDIQQIDARVSTYVRVLEALDVPDGFALEISCL